MEIGNTVEVLLCYAKAIDMSQKELSDIRRKLWIFYYGKEIENVSKACRHLASPAKLIAGGNGCTKCTAKGH